MDKVIQQTIATVVVHIDNINNIIIFYIVTFYYNKKYYNIDINKNIDIKQKYIYNRTYFIYYKTRILYINETIGDAIHGRRQED
jgi:hypothetical protein